jgi:hypothetical protein
VDVVLRARHDELVEEFPCASTALRLVRTPAGSPWTRTIEAFCADGRAQRFGTQLTDFASCCASCAFFLAKSTHDTAMAVDGGEDVAAPA